MRVLHNHSTPFTLLVVQLADPKYVRLILII